MKYLQPDFDSSQLFNFSIVRPLNINVGHCIHRQAGGQVYWKLYKNFKYAVNHEILTENFE